ncbi:MAG: hypothetical protein JXR77_07115 [Lentisphaeria bacterium]|nr:hypothetical protein [Lentisphaeria bacterium]
MNGSCWGVTCLEAQPTSRPEVRLLHSQGVTELRLRIDGALRPADGSRPMGSAWETTCPLVDRLTVTAAGSSTGGDGLRLTFRSSLPLDRTAAAEFMRVTPGVPCDLQREDWWGGGMHWALQGGFRPRTYYRLTFLKGLPAADGLHTLEEEVNLGVVTRDLHPLLEMAGSGTVFPAHRPHLLPIRFRNTAYAHLKAYRVYPNNLIAWLKGPFWAHDRAGHFAGEVTVQPGLPENEQRVLNVPFDDMLGEHRRGLFVIEATRCDMEGAYGSARRTLVLTDIGLAAATTRDTLCLWTLGLADTNPLGDCQVDILSAKNQVLAQGRSGADGTLILDLPPGRPEEREPFLVVVRRGEDLSLLALDEGNSIDTESVEPSGRPAPAQAYEAMVNTDRGVLRPGETLSCHAIVRTPALDPAANLPLEMRLLTPDGAVLRRYRGSTAAEGLFVQAVDLPAEARYGRYTLEVGMPGNAENAVWGAASVLVAEFRPDRLRCALSLDRALYRPGEDLQATVQADYYFGRAAAASDVTFSLTLSDAPFRPEGYEQFAFGDDEKPFCNPEPLRQGTVTGEGGAAVTTFRVPTGLAPAAALAATVSASVAVPGGESVSVHRRAAVHPYPYYIGLAPARDHVERVRGDDMPFEWVLVAPDGATVEVPDSLPYELLFSHWEYVLRRLDDGTYRREWQQQTDSVSRGKLDTHGATRGLLRVTCPQPGSYRLRLGQAEGGPLTSYGFWFCEEGISEARPESPAFLVLTTDRPVYRPGETARIRLSSPGQGHAFAVVALGSALVHAAATPVAAGENEIGVPLPDTALGSCTLAVTLATVSPDGPCGLERTFGMTGIRFDQSPHSLQVTLAAPERVQPGERLPVRVEVQRSGEPAPALVHLTIVDAGVLALTRHATPDPFGFFHGPRRCEARFADLFDAIVPQDPEPYATVSTVAGDGIGHFLAGGRPQEQRHTVALSCVVEVNESGLGGAGFVIPDFSGELRITAVAVGERALGSASRPLTVRHPLTILPAVPRVLAPGDTFTVTATIHPDEEVSGTGMVSLALRGPAEIVSPAADQILALEPGRGVGVRWQCRTSADATGTLQVAIEARCGNTHRLVQESVRVRHGSPPRFRARFLTVAAGEESSLPLPEDYLPGGLWLSAQVSPSRQVETTAALAWLADYPYGCLEQSVSMAFMELCFRDLARALDASADTLTADRRRFDAAISCLVASELPSGGFAMWRHGHDLWLSGSIYACHLLAEGERRGLPAESALRQRLVRFLVDAVCGRHEGVSVGDRAYALYLLTVLGSPETALAQGLAADAALPPLARLLAGVAVAGAGRAAEAAPTIRRMLTEDPRGGVMGWDFDSDIRRQAMALCLAAEVDPEGEAVARLAQSLRASRTPEGHWGTTQNNALVLLALSRIGNDAPQGTARVTVSGRDPLTVQGQDVLTLGSAEVRAGVTLAAAGGPVFVALQERGVPRELPRTDLANGLTFEREYLGEDGQRRAAFRHGELVTVRLTFRSPVYRRNIAVADLLPGGFEVEDTAFVTRQGTGREKGDLHISMRQNLEDRLVLCLDLPGGDQGVTYSYGVRAVTPGEFLAPRARAEAMYDPQVAAECGGSERVTVQ